jgi:uncharacterized SAM-binding protein YcdF (DUF218 family)
VNGSYSWLRSIAVVLVGTVVLLVVVYFSLGRDAAEKIGTALFMPSGLVWLMLIALCLQLWPLRRSDRPAGGWTALLCLVAYSLGGSGYISDFMASSLEAPYVQINPLTEPPVDIVVVLGGGGSQGANGRLQGNGSGDRMILAAQLYHKDPATKFLVTGQRIESMNSSGVDPADTSLDILTRLGVPESSIERIGGKNTSEEMQNLGARFKDSSLRIGLLTSAWHLPRATRLATRNGLKTVPLPADFRSSPPGQAPTMGQRIEALIPNGAAFGSTWSFAKEYVGMLIGR